MFKRLFGSDEFWLGWDFLLIPWITLNLLESIVAGNLLWIIVQATLLPLLIVVTVLTYRRVSRDEKTNRKIHDALMTNEPFRIEAFGAVYSREETSGTVSVTR